MRASALFSEAIDCMRRKASTGLYPQRPCRSRLSLDFANLLPERMPELPADAPNVLMIVPRGMVYDLVPMGVIALRLHLEGLRPLFVLCDNMPMCSSRVFNQSARPNLCDECLGKNVDFLSFNGFDYMSVWEYLETADVREARDLASSADVANLRQVHYGDIPLGALQEMAAGRYFLRDKPDNSEQGVTVGKQFLYSGLLLAKAFERIYSETKPHFIMSILGKTNWSSIAVALARRDGIRAITFDDRSTLGTGTGSVWGFNSEDFIANLNWKKAWENWKDVPLTEEENQVIDDLERKKRNHPWMYPNPVESKEAIEKELGRSLSDQPIVSMFTSNIWDACAMHIDLVFNNMFEWVNETIRFAAGKPFTLVVRIHPAETALKGFESTKPTIDIIKQEHPKLPSNVVIIPPRSQISSHTIVRLSKVILCNNSTLAMDAAIHQVPSIIAGKPNYRGRGFTIDVESREEYFSYLEDLRRIPPYTSEQAELARRYIYLLNNRTRIPLHFAVSREWWSVSHYNVHSFDEIKPGADPFLDVLIDHLVNDGDFTLPRELGFVGTPFPVRVYEELPIVEQTRQLFGELQACQEAFSSDPQNAKLQKHFELLDCQIRWSEDALSQQTSERISGARRDYQLGRTDQAVGRFEEILGQEPNNATALVGLARILLDFKRIDEAQLLLVRACKACPTRDESWQWLVNSYQQKGDNAGVLQRTQEWLSLRQSSIPALVNAAGVLLEQGSTNELRTILQRIQDLGGHPVATRLLGSLGLIREKRPRRKSAHSAQPEKKSPAPIVSQASKSQACSRSKPKVSVLLCSYNRGDKIGNFFEALKKQTLPRDQFEVICVNDGSTDNTGEEMQRALAEMPGRYIEHETNLALAAARNSAIKAADGELLLFINDDTYPEPTLLEEHLRIHHKHQGEKIAVCGSMPFTPELEERLFSRVLFEFDMLFPLHGIDETKGYDFDHFVTGNVSISRDAFVVEDIWFDETFLRYGCEDIEVGYRLWKRGYLVYHNQQARVAHDHCLTIDDYCRREDANNSNLVQFIDKHPELLSRYLQIPSLSEETLMQWRREVELEQTQVSKLIEEVRSLQELPVHMNTAEEQKKGSEIIQAVGQALRCIQSYYKKKAILETLEKLPDVRARLVHTKTAVPQGFPAG